MPILSSHQRKALEDACTKGRRASEQAVRAALTPLDVAADRPPAHLTEDARQLRRGLRAKARQLGDRSKTLDLLVAECSYEQWHRLLFARFLAENDLLIHPDYRAPVSLEDCSELAESLCEPDGWSVAGRFAAAILPGIFRLDDPCVQIRLAPEGRLSLENVVAGLPVEIFACDDALGWVYQFWQQDKKAEVNASERKIGGADLGPVTQLFTEHYMVQFLLQNSLGAWWATRRPRSPLLRDFRYLRVGHDGEPVAGAFQDWPSRVAEITVTDPSCGSGHFLVEAFSMLSLMRAEEEGFTLADAQDAVLRDNLFGLELDPRCVQIAMFALALHAWTSGGGWRELPVPNVACSGVPVKAPVDEWKALAHGDERLENALARLHVLFREADSFGSLIDPRRTSEISDPTGLQASFDDVEWDQIEPLLARALTRESADPATAVLGADATSIIRAASFLARSSWLVITNPPYLGRIKQSETLREFVERYYRHGRQDLATAFLQRMWALAEPGGMTCVVVPQNWMVQPTYEDLRVDCLKSQTLVAGAVLGEEAFESFGIRGPRVVLLVMTNTRPPADSIVATLDVSTPPGRDQVLIPEKQAGLAGGKILELPQHLFSSAPSHRISFVEHSELPTLRKYAESFQGLKSGDDARLRQYFWEHAETRDGWRHAQGSPENGSQGLHFIVKWGDDGHDIARAQGLRAWGREGIAVTRTRNIIAAPYAGVPFFSEIAVIVPRRPEIIPALRRFALSGELERTVRNVDRATILSNGTFLDVPFDLDRWEKEVRQREPHNADADSRDPTQWVSNGRPDKSANPLQVAVGRLLGYRWPAQNAPDVLDDLADEDGIVCLPSVRGERPAADRLEGLLARAFGTTWSPARTLELISLTGSTKKDLHSWLRDDFFKAHCQLFKNRPFVWHVWDGRRDGFSALLNYHKLDRAMLEKLTYSYLGDWIERQLAGARDDEAGAEHRLADAKSLKSRLELVLRGEPPNDIFVRWKSIEEQAVGWDPDPDDGLRINMRPFVNSAVLRAKFNVSWGKDRGRNADGSERLNDIHLTIAEKLAAQGDRA